MSSTDQIRKQVVLRAPRARVWDALTDATKFGAWFGAAFEAPFVPGQRTHGRIVPTQVDPAIAKEQEPYAGVAFFVDVERIEPMNHFSFRWHPGDADASPDLDLEREPTTLVVFELKDAPDGVLLTITESGFDAIPIERRAKAFEMNDAGWDGQARLIAAYLADAA